MLFLMITGHQLLFFFLDPSFYSIPNTTIGAFLQGLFQSLNLSPDGRYLSPWRNIGASIFVVIVCIVLTAIELYPT
jgi:hypothetical protein